MNVTLGGPAHGGYTVARIHGKVVFVSGGLPGENVDLEITERGKSFDRARVVDVHKPHQERVSPPCPIADECGGCAWQHASPRLQREMKTIVVKELLRRFGDYEWAGEVREVPPTLRWRSKMRYTVAGQQVGMRAERSHHVIALPEAGCVISAATLDVRPFAKNASSIEVAQGDNDTAILVDGQLVAGPKLLRHRVGDRTYTAAADQFWQPHLFAPSVLVNTVMGDVQPQPGEVAVDLYCGVGLFAGALADAGCEVYGVEYQRSSIELARLNVPEGVFSAAAVGRGRAKLPRRADLVVMDPPRKGAGRDGIRLAVGLKPRAISYVACDPASLARDLKLLTQQGYRVTRVQAFDLFPMTHHVETVALCKRAEDSLAQ